MVLLYLKWKVGLKIMDKNVFYSNIVKKCFYALLLFPPGIGLGISLSSLSLTQAHVIEGLLYQLCPLSFSVGKCVLE